MTPAASALASLIVGAAPAAAAPSAPDDGKAPPAVYVDRRACPFEGCTYGAWTARADVPLLDRPGGTATGVVVKAGERVEALGGEVHVRPLRVVCRRPVELGAEGPGGAIRLAPGESYWLLGYEGEGVYKVWVRGVIRTWSADFGIDFGRTPRGYCSERPGGCAVEPAGGREEYLRWTREGAVWWVKLRRASGEIGWTRAAEEFDGKDLLG